MRKVAEYIVLEIKEGGMGGGISKVPHTVIELEGGTLIWKGSQILSTDDFVEMTNNLVVDLEEQKNEE